MHKFGFIPDFDNADTNEEVWDGTGAYAFPASAVAMKISSASGNDASGGTGANTVRVLGLDADYKVVSSDIAMNGQTGVAISPNLLRVFRAYVLTSGSVGTNDDDIWVGTGTITSGVPAVKYAGILDDFGQTLMAVYTTPATSVTGKVYKAAQIDRWWGRAAANVSGNGTLALQVLHFGGAWRTHRLITVSSDGGWQEEFSWPISIGTKADVRVRVVNASANNMAFSAGFDISMWK